MRKIVIFLFVWLASSATAFAGTTTEAKIGAWEIFSYRDDNTQHFAHCSTLVPYQSGISMMISLDKSFNWKMGFANTGWSLQVGAKYPITYWIDNGIQIPGEALVALPTMVVVPLINNIKLFDAFRRGRTLNVVAAGEQFKFDLTNSSRALKAVAECTVHYVSPTQTASNPFDGSARPGNGANSDTALKVEAATFTANMLSAAGVPEFQMVDEIPAQSPYGDYHSVFIAPGIVGGMRIFPEESESALSLQLMAASTQKCAGRAATAKLPMPGTGTHVQTLCDQDGVQRESSYFVLPRKRGGVYGIELTKDVIGQGALPTQPSKPDLPISDVSGRLLEAGMKLAK